MNLFKKINWLFIALISLITVASCSDDDTDFIGGNQAYLRLRLKPQAVTRAKLDDMSDAKKAVVTLLYLDKELTLTQPLTLTSIEGAADMGLESEKLELAPGEYELLSYTLYAAIHPGQQEAEKLMTVYPEEVQTYTLTAGHITEAELKVKASVRGEVSFDVLKDLSTNYQKYMDAAQAEADKHKATRALTPEDPTLFSYSAVDAVEVYYRRKGTSEQPMPKYFAKVYTTSIDDYIHTDTMRMEVGEYEITEYRLYEASGDKPTRLLLAGNPEDAYFTVEPYVCNQEKVAVTFPANMKSIQDYLALYDIWVSLEGWNWSYSGESFPVGANWRFAGRPIDEWGNQPGVEIDKDGRVKTLDLGTFNPKGEVSPSLGNLTELYSLWLGTHNDVVTVEDDSEMYKLNMYELHRKGVDLRAHRMEIAKERLRLLEPKKTSNIYGSEKKKFKYATPGQYDLNAGSVTNRITKIPEEIGNLTNLTYLFIANGKVSELPESMANLKQLTDLELYNCPFEEFPEVLTKMTSIISLNFSNNPTIAPDELYDGLNRFIESNKDELQILYASACGLEKFPEALKDVTRIGLLDFRSNRLTELPNTDRQLAPVQLYFDHNRIEKIDPEFCNTDDIETLSVSNNLLKEFPDMFKDGAESMYTIETVDFSDNHITKFADGFKGICTKTLTLTKNDFHKNTDPRYYKKGKHLFPYDLAETKSRISHLEIADCGIDSLDVKALKFDDNLKMLEALNISSNNLKYISYDFDAVNFPFLTGVNLSYNSLVTFPLAVLGLPMLNKLYVSDQVDRKTGLSSLKDWYTSLSSYPASFTLRLMDVSYNDIQRIPEEQFPVMLVNFNVEGNPNLEMEMPADVCTRIANGLFTFGYSPEQYITGCSILDLDINK